MKNYYEVLEIDFQASQENIKKAFRQKAIKYHPDKHFGDKYFTEKFIEVREAYETLSNIDKKTQYDIVYQTTYLKKEPQQIVIRKQEKRQEQEKEEKFFYDPYKAFYSFNDRFHQETPQVFPIIDFWGNKISDEADFFCLPQRIGKIVCGYTTLKKSDMPKTGFLSGIRNFTFIHKCAYIGVNGFAESLMHKNRETKALHYEINFNDLLGVSVIYRQNYNSFIYQNTTFSFMWFNKNGDAILELEDTFESKSNNPDKSNFGYWSQYTAEKYWTVFLLDNLEQELVNKGFIEFMLVGYDKANKKPATIKFIEMGIGYIKFIYANRETTYQFNEIKNMYIKNGNLFIENKNYEKKFLFLSSGDKDGIPLANLMNKNYFFKAVELLLGYKFD